jgi:hypothetical protein
VPLVVATVTHDADEETVHAHVEPVVTVIVPLPPLGAAVTSSGDTENEHVGLGSNTTKLLPATVSVAVRADPEVLAAAVKLTKPVPVRLVPFEIVTHVAPLDALHVHPALVVTVMLPVPPDARSARLAGEIANEQVRAAWLTVKVLPATVTVPVRATEVLLAATT